MRSAEEAMEKPIGMCIPLVYHTSITIDHGGECHGKVDVEIHSGHICSLVCHECRKELGSGSVNLPGIAPGAFKRKLKLWCGVGVDGVIGFGSLVKGFPQTASAGWMTKNEARRLVKLLQRAISWRGYNSKETREMVARAEAEQARKLKAA